MTGRAFVCVSREHRMSLQLKAQACFCFFCRVAATPGVPQHPCCLYVVWAVSQWLLLLSSCLDVDKRGLMSSGSLTATFAMTRQ